MNVVDLTDHDPVTGMCTSPTPLPHRHQFCQLPFGHEGDHQWTDAHPAPEDPR